MATETTLEELYTFDKATGTIDPADYSVVEAIVKSDVCTALGVENSVEMSTPMGRLLEWLALHFSGVLGLNVQNANQLLISAASGQQLDAMAQWFQLERRPQSYSIVTVRCYGNSFTETVIPLGSTVRNENGDVFESTEEKTIPAKVVDTDAPFVDVPFEAIEAGAIDVAANTVNIVDSAVSGWESCNNPDAGTAGSAIETDESLRDRIRAARTVAPGFLGAIKNAVEAVVGSGSAMAIENNTGAKLDVHGVEMEKHSILVCVDGLESPTVEGYASNEKVQAVAKAIFDNKPCGTGYTKPISSKSYQGQIRNPDGTTTDIVPSNYQYDVPISDAFGNEYHVFFCAPLPQYVTVSLQVQNRTYTGTNILGDVRNAVQAWASEANLQCGEDIYASDIIRAVEDKVPGVVVVDCTVSDGGVDKGTSFLEIDAIHKASITTILPTQYSK